MDPPDTRYAKTKDGVHIAYQVVGDGPIDLIFVPGFVSNVEYPWQQPALARFLRRLASFTRLIVFDKRGTGLSDRVPNDRLPGLETRMDDIRAVMDVAGAEHAVLFGASEGTALCALFGATYPERTDALVLYGSYARETWAADYPWSTTTEEWPLVKDIEASWGTTTLADILIPDVAPSEIGDDQFRNWFATYMRVGASPGAAATLSLMNLDIDVREILATVHVPTLVLHRTHDPLVNLAEGRYMAEHLANATLQVLPGVDHFPWVGDQEVVTGHVEEFLTGTRHIEAHRVLATVLFTDIVDSTRMAAELGDHAWQNLLDEHDARVRDLIAQHQGREINTAGDGFLATFDGPARGVRCAKAVVQAVRPLGIEVRAGLHTGECELTNEKVGGIAVHIGARVAGLARAGEVLVSSTVKDLTAGSGLAFEDAGEHVLKGVPDRWHLYRVTD
jgi:pimeloyl-ACP methyl ester carboxylesterase